VARGRVQPTRLEREVARESPAAREIYRTVANRENAFGVDVSAEVLNRADTLISQITIPADGTAIPPITPFWGLAAPDGIVQSREVVTSRMSGQVDFSIQAVAIQWELDLGELNWDFIQQNSLLTIDSVDQNLLRRPMSSNVCHKQAEFDTAVATTVAATTINETLITGTTPRGVDLDPSQFLFWERDQTLNMQLLWTPGAILPFALGGPGTVTTLILQLWGSKLTDLKG
jgi:hypothetical protein